MSAPSFTFVGEHALRFELAPRVDRRALLAYLRAIPGVRDASVAAEHALVVFDGAPFAIELPDALPRAPTPSATHTVRVAYDGADLDEVARSLALDVASLVALHTERTYEVQFLGFMPGFAYLGPVDARLASVSRRASPRPRVPAGSVALAGGYTGIYPAASPGGWQLLGRALDFDPFDGERTRFAVGDVVRFVPA